MIVADDADLGRDANTRAIGTSNPSVSADGTLVGFSSTASNLVAGDTNSRNDVFVHDRATGETVRKSLTAAGGQANDANSDPWISGDGTAIAFESVATNLVAEDTDATKDVYVRGPAIDAATYGYDRLYRLTGVNGPDGARSYAYDPAGNRTAADTGSGPVSSTYDRADRITAAGSTSITVNGAGNLTAKGSDGFAYDQANRLISATVSGSTETYAYDGDGVRFSRTIGTDPAVRFVTDVAAGLPVTLDDGTRKYVWGLGMAYAVSGTAIEVYHADRLGSVRALTDVAGDVVATYRTDEWGVPTATTGSSTQPFGFTGEPADATGLTYLRARYLDPGLGRFMTRDQWPGSTEQTATLHRYAYVANNPATLSDPSGRFLPLLLVAGAALLGAGAGAVAYTGGVAISNTVQGKPLTEGWNPTDAGISAVAGATSGVLATTGLGLGALAIANAVVGFDATVVSMVAGSRRDPSELVWGTVFGAIGPFLPGGKGVTGFIRGVVSSTAANAGQSIVTSGGPPGSSLMGRSKSLVLASGPRGRWE